MNSTFLTNGYVVLKKILSISSQNEITQEIQHFIQTHKNHLRDREINYTKDGQINSIHNLFLSKNNFFYQQAHSQKFLNIASELLGEEAECRGSELFLKPAEHGLPSPPHQDDFYWCIEDHQAFTLWISLDHSSEENGGVYFWRGSHKLGLLPHENSFAPGSSQTIKDLALLTDFSIETPNLGPGDAVAHHALTAHGSTPNQSKKPRRAWTIQYKKKSSAYDENRKASYLQNLQLQINQRSKS